MSNAEKDVKDIKDAKDSSNFNSNINKEEVKPNIPVFKLDYLKLYEALNVLKGKMQLSVLNLQELVTMIQNEKSDLLLNLIRTYLIAVKDLDIISNAGNYVRKALEELKLENFKFNATLRVFDALKSKNFNTMTDFKAFMLDTKYSDFMFPDEKEGWLLLFKYADKDLNLITTLNALFKDFIGFIDGVLSTITFKDLTVLNPIKEKYENYVKIESARFQVFCKEILKDVISTYLLVRQKIN